VAPKAVVGVRRGATGFIAGVVELRTLARYHPLRLRPRPFALVAPRAPGGPSAHYHALVGTAPAADDWVEITEAALPVAPATRWAYLPSCGAVVSFVGTVRDHAEGREGVVSLEYEAYLEQAVARMQEVAAAARQRWPELGRLALVHRVGLLEVGEPSVVVVVSAPHRAGAFEAARYCIDTLKATVPIWKKETWEEGSGWGTGAQPVAMVGGLPPTAEPKEEPAG
jgi:molybdopterin synthase catalytic subunit